tara:strand:- start:132 stop:497 length:366 start_codon:yes stop_codon:yes gene_type:complete
MGDFNQIGSAMEDPMRRQAFQNFMMMPGGAAGLGMPEAGRDQSFQDYMNKRMQEDAQRRAMEMQEQRMRDMTLRNREFGERSAAKATNRIGEMMDKRGVNFDNNFRSGMFPPIPFGPAGMY